MVIKIFSILVCTFILITAENNFAYSQGVPSTENDPITRCDITDRLCLMKQINKNAMKIEEQSWRDQTLRELAKAYAADSYLNEAIALIPLIKTPDTQAMTIRGIGMELADLQKSKEEKDAVFQTLRAEAEKITHPPSYAIALTYIAMSQAFAGDNEGAWATAASMKNDALRHKAYAETAEIQAQQGDSQATMKTIEFIESSTFRNKAYDITSGIFAKAGNFDDAYTLALKIENAYKQAKALQNILDAQSHATKQTLPESKNEAAP